MTGNETEPVGEVRRVRRFRYLIDIIALAAAAIALEIGIGAVYAPGSMRSQFILAAVVQLLVVVIAWLLIRLRGERLANIGLKTPESWWRTILIGLAIAAVVFVAMYLSEKAGFR